MSRNSMPGGQITEVDLVILRALTRYRAATMAMIMRKYFPCHHRTGVYARLRRLVRAGLLEDLQSGPSNLWRPAGLRALYVPTAAGYSMVDSPLKARPVDLGTVEHTIAIAEIGLAEERPDVTVWTDREIAFELVDWRQSYDVFAPEVPLWLSADVHHRTSKKGPRVRTHRPDLVIHDVRPGRDRLTAVEVEMSIKGAARLRTLLRWYARAQTFDRVRYVVRNEAVRRNVLRAIASLPEDQRGLFRVTMYEPLHSVEPEREEEIETFAPSDESNLPDGSDITLPAEQTPSVPTSSGQAAQAVAVVQGPRLPTQPLPVIIAGSAIDASGPTFAPATTPTGQDVSLGDDAATSAPSPVEADTRMRPGWWDLPGAPGMWRTD